MRAKRLTMKYNSHLPDDATPESLQADREKILSELLGRVGPECYIEPPFHVDYGCNVSIGRNFYANVKYANPLSYICICICLEMLADVLA